jgi:hypothetical protein
LYPVPSGAWASGMPVLSWLDMACVVVVFVLVLVGVELAWGVELRASGVWCGSFRAV